MATYVVRFYNIQSNLQHSEHSVSADSPREAEQTARELLNNQYGRDVHRPKDRPQDYAQYFRAVVLGENGEATDVEKPQSEPASTSVSSPPESYADWYKNGGR